MFERLPSLEAAQEALPPRSMLRFFSFSKISNFDAVWWPEHLLPLFAYSERCRPHPSTKGSKSFCSPKKIYCRYCYNQLPCPCTDNTPDIYRPRNDSNVLISTNSRPVQVAHGHTRNLHLEATSPSHRQTPIPLPKNRHGMGKPLCSALPCMTI